MTGRVSSDPPPSGPGVGEARRRASSKVNLWLAVHGRRDDGYHELSTLMLALDWGDEVRARAADGGGLSLSLSGPALSPDIPASRDNLAYRAAELALERALSLGHPAPGGLALQLVKNVPSQAGLGGGSADVVATLEVVEELLGIDLGLEWKRAQCARLGADCSFFLEVGESGLALCEGIGERVRPWGGPRPPWFVALVIPEAVSPTGAVFAALDLACGPRRTCPLGLDLARSPLEQVRSALYTDLEAAALAAVPELRVWRDWLDAHGARHYRLSGSGSTFFGLHTSEAEAAVELEDLRRRALERGLALRGVHLARPHASEAPRRLLRGDTAR